MSTGRKDAGDSPQVTQDGDAVTLPTTRGKDDLTHDENKSSKRAGGGVLLGEEAMEDGADVAVDQTEVFFLSIDISNDSIHCCELITEVIK